MRQKTYDLVYTGMFAVFLAICSWISIPTIVPFTLQTLGIFLSLFVLGGKRGTITILIYLLLGLIGIPVFSHFGAGPGYLLGNTGGYAIGFLLIGLCYWGFEKLFFTQTRFQILALLLGLFLCYLFGSFWFLFISTSSNNLFEFKNILGICVVPFIFPDLLKLGLAYMISKRIKPILYSI